MGEAEFVNEKVFATLPRTTRGLPVVMGASPDGRRLVYCNGNGVIIRDVDNPSVSDVYTEHSAQTTVAKYSPSGFYIASGDQSGKVRIWDTTQKEHPLKGEYPVINGPVRDIAWAADNQRLAVVGEGRERFGHVFLLETGTSNGNLSGQTKSMTSVDFRPERPFRIVSGSEDNSVAFFEGPPFKFKTLFHQHSRFVNCVRYKPDGTLFATAGADGKVHLFEGKEGDLLGELVDTATQSAKPPFKNCAHLGGVYCLAFVEGGGSRLLTASGDRTAKLWDVEAKTLLATFEFGSEVENQQVACLSVGEHLLSVGLNGFISYLDFNNPKKPLKVLMGHNKPITTMTVSPNRQFVYTADFEGNTTRWDSQSGESVRIEPKLHNAMIAGLSVSNNGTLASVGWDDCLAFTKNVVEPSLGKLSPQTIKLPSQPRGVSLSQDGRLAAVAVTTQLLLFADGVACASAPAGGETTCVALSPENNFAAVGCQENVLVVFKVGAGGRSIEKYKEIKHSGAVTAVAFSPNGKFLCATDASRRVVPYSVDNDFQSAAQKEWTFHSAKVNCLAWAENSRHVVTGGLDTNLIVWDVERSGEHPIIIKGAHAMSQVNGVAWLNNNMAVSVGQDANVKQWTLRLS